MKSDLLTTPLQQNWPAETQRLMATLPDKGIFLTGIEGSDPMVKDRRRDQFKEAGDFYVHYAERLQRIRDLGITWLRLGPPYSKTHLAADQYDFAWFDKVVERCQELGIELIFDLLHFGLPDWMHNDAKGLKYFQNPAFPQHLAHYAEVVAKRYPHISWFTPVNEPLVTATFSSQIGIWNEGHTSGEAYANCVYNIAQAAILARQAIDRVWAEEKRKGKPLYVQNESFEWAIPHPGDGMEDEATLFNKAYRFAPLDLIFGHQDSLIHDYLMSRNLPEQEYEWCMKHGTTERTLLGIDFYPTCVHVFHKDHATHYDPTMPYEMYRLIRDYWQRYPLPLLHTEVNGWPEHAERLCQETYDQLFQLKQEGYPIVGMAWYGDESQVDWHNALTAGDEETPVGLFRNGELQPVAKVFSALSQKGFQR